MKYDSTETSLRIMAYIDGKLDFKEKKSFEDELERSSDLLNYTLELKKDRVLLEEARLEKTPDYLLRQVLAGKVETVGNRSSGWGEVVLRLRDTCLDFVKNSFSVAEPQKELFTYRDSACQAEKVVFRREDFNLTVMAISEDRVSVLVAFPEVTEEKDHVELYRRTDRGLRLVASFQPAAQTVEFQDLVEGAYVLRVKKQDLSLDILDE